GGAVTNDGDGLLELEQGDQGGTQHVFVVGNEDLNHGCAPTSPATVNRSPLGCQVKVPPWSVNRRCRLMSPLPWPAYGLAASVLAPSLSMMSVLALMYTRTFVAREWRRILLVASRTSAANNSLWCFGGVPARRTSTVIPAAVRSCSALPSSALRFRVR